MRKPIAPLRRGFLASGQSALPYREGFVTSGLATSWLGSPITRARCCGGDTTKPQSHLVTYKCASALTTPSGTRQKWRKSLILLQSLKSVSHCPTENPLGCSCNLLIYIYLFNKSNSSGTVGHEKKRVYDFVSALLRDWVTTKSLRDRKKQKLIILRVPLSHCPTKIVTLCFHYVFQWDTPLVSHLEPVSHCPTWRI